MNEIMYSVCIVKVSFMNFVNYCYIVMDKNTKSAVIIDPAWNMKLIEKKLLELSAKPVAVLLTHSHMDHVNLAEKVACKYNIDVFISREEADYSNFKCKNMKYITTNSELYFGDTKVACLLTPGHTRGSMCYSLEQTLFTGDTVFIEGVGICKNEKAAAALFDSVQYLKSRINSSVLVYPGHSYGKEVGCPFQEILNNNIYFLIGERRQFIDFRLRAGQRNWFKFT